MICLERNKPLYSPVFEIFYHFFTIFIQQSVNMNYNSTRESFVVLSFIVFAFLMTTGYTSSLLQILMTTNEYVPFKSAEDIYFNDMKVYISYLTIVFLEDSNLTLNSPHIFFNRSHKFESLIKKRDFAIIGLYSELHNSVKEFNSKQTELDSVLLFDYPSTQQFLEFPSMRDNHPLYRKISRLIENTIERGLTLKWVEELNKEKVSVITEQDEELNMRLKTFHLLGIFVVLVISLSLSLLIFFIELFCGKQFCLVRKTKISY